MELDRIARQLTFHSNEVCHFLSDFSKQEINELINYITTTSRLTFRTFLFFFLVVCPSSHLDISSLCLATYHRIKQFVHAHVYMCGRHISNVCSDMQMVELFLSLSLHTPVSTTKWSIELSSIKILA